MAGHPPFVGDDALTVAMRHVDDQVPPLPHDVPPTARDLIVKAMAKNPRRRFRTGVDLAEAAARLVAELGSQPPAVPPGALTLRPAVPVATHPPRTTATRRTTASAAVLGGAAAVLSTVAATDPVQTPPPNRLGLSRSADPATGPPGNPSTAGVGGIPVVTATWGASTPTRS